MDKKQFDVTIFGATGYTGLFVVEELARNAQEKPIKWAIAGRNIEKLAKVLEEATKNTGLDLMNIPKIESDCSDTESLLKMCKETKVVINCVGPYIFYGEAVVKACIEGKAHHVDISAEPKYLEGMRLKYFEEAQAAGVFIVGACGYESVPVDMAAVLGRKHIKGDVNSIEVYMNFKSIQKSKVNTGTLESLVHVVSDFDELKDLDRQINEKFHKKPLPPRKFPLASKGRLFHSELLGSWCVLFSGPEFLKRSTLLNYEHNNDSPPQVNVYFAWTLFHTIGILLGMPLAYIAFKFNFIKNFVLKFPGFSTLGLFKKGGPTRQQLSEVTFSITMVLEGWKEKLVQGSEEYTEAPDKRVVVTVSGPDPGYTSTAIFLVQSGLTILNEANNLPGSGGIFPPGFAFQNTNLIENLKNRGIEFLVTEI